MLLRSNQDLFNTIKALAGVNDFTTEETTNLVDLTNRRLQMAYNTSPMWDRYVVVSEARKLSSFIIQGYSNDSDNIPYYKYGTYEHTTDEFSDFYIPNNNQSNKFVIKNASGAWIWGTGAYTKDSQTDVVTLSGAASVVATQVDVDSTGAVIKHDTPSEVKEWSISVGSGTLSMPKKQVVVYDEPYQVFNSGTSRTQKTKINDFIRIHRVQAFLNKSSTEYDFYVDSQGANVLNSSATGDEVYVTYKKPIANQTTGLIISSLTSGTEIPSEFFNYTAHAVYADFLRMDGQHDKAAFEEQKADMFLATELERIDIINNNNSLNHKFSTYINTSSR